MSNTKAVREKCKHNRYEGHHYRNPDYPGDGRSNPKFITKELFCQGGKEIVLREAFRWDTQDSLTVDWEPGFNGKPFFVEVVEE